MRPYGSALRLERRRRRAIVLMQQGHGPAPIARLLDTTPQSVGRWLRAYQQGGVRALALRPSKLTPRQKRSLVGCLLNGPVACGFATDLWTCPRIAQLIRSRWRIDYHVDHIPRLLAGLGFSPSEAPASGRRTRRRGDPSLGRA